MMRKAILALAVAVAISASLAALAQDAQGLSAARQAENRYVLQTARGLIAYGEAKGDPMALVVAARMISGVPGRVLADGQSGTAGASAAVDFDIETILKKAESLSGGDPFVAKAIADLRAKATADEEQTCYWEYYCYYNGECEYSYSCW